MVTSLASRTRSVDAASRPTSQASAANLDGDLIVPNRSSSLHSRTTQQLPTAQHRNAPKVPKTLTHAYMVCGVGREPAQWIQAPSPAQGKITHMRNAVGQYWLPEILGSSPRLEQDNEIAQSLHSAMRACFPHDVEICTGKSQPHCVHHAFVLQQDSSHTLYGIALRVWSRADDKRAETIREMRRKTEADYLDTAGETYWIPYCLSFLSRYPLYNLLGDYLRGMWIHWNKATNLFHAEEVSRILSFPAPRLQDLVRIDMKDYALYYQFPASPTGFQNFALWPLFSCLSLSNLAGVISAAVAPTSRIIFLSHYPAMLTIAAETLRFCVRVYEWSGLYVPIVHARDLGDLVHEPGPYMLGATSDCRSLFNAPLDAMVVDLDKNRVFTQDPPSMLTSSQSHKLITRLTRALGASLEITGVPQHLRSAYGAGKLIPAGEIIPLRGQVERITNPVWWKQDAVMAIMDAMCDKLGRNHGFKAMLRGTQKKPLVTEVSTRHLHELIRERNQYSRDALQAWQDFINLKTRMDMEVSKVTKRNNFLVDELESWKQQFLKFQAFAEQLTKEIQDLKAKLDSNKKENKRVAVLLDQQREEATNAKAMVQSTERQRDNALEALVLQQELAEDLERERQRNKNEYISLLRESDSLQRQRDEAQRVVLHLRALIDGQATHMQHLVQTLAGQAADASGPARQSNVRSPSTDSRIDDTDERTPTSHPQVMHMQSPSQRYIQGGDIADVADKKLRDKTDAITYIIQNISEQCAAAVEGLQLGREDSDAVDSPMVNGSHSPALRGKTPVRKQSENELGSEYDDALSVPSRSPHLAQMKHRSSVPPTPDLVSSSNGARDSTATSHTSMNTMDLRGSMQSTWRNQLGEDIPEMPALLIRSDDSGLVEDVNPIEHTAAKLSAKNLENARGMTT